MTAAQPPLWRQVQAAAALLADVRSGQSLAGGLGQVEPAVRPGAQALLYHALRWLGRAEALRRKLAARTPPPAADAILCTALALAWQADGAAYDPHTLVDQAVEAAKRWPAARPQAGFVNACLRRFLRERDALVAATDGEPVAQWNHPRWWIDRVRADHPRQWQGILAANCGAAPMVLRASRLHGGRDAALTALATADIAATPVGADGLVLTSPRAVQAIPGFAEGRLSVQDAAAQLAAPLLLQAAQPAAPGASLRVLDACAAPGGKTAHLLDVALAAGRPIDLVALDVDPQRCARIGENLQRLGLAGQARVVAADAQAPETWWPQLGQPRFDAILLDAPCTASGVVRRHPDVRWLRRDSDVQQLAITQAGLLTTLWPLLRPGGHLLYCTCSVFRAEGEEPVAAFVAHHTDCTRLPAPGHLLPQPAAPAPPLEDNLPGDHDGFFYALLHKHGG